MKSEEVFLHLDDRHPLKHIIITFTSFKNVGPLVTYQDERFRLFFNRKVTDLTYGRTLTILVTTSAKKTEKSFRARKVPEHFLFGQYTFPMKW